MARVVDRLTARGILALSKPGLHSDGGGLYLRVDQAGSKRWTFIFRWRGKRCEMGLGSIVDISLAEARGKAAQTRKQIQAGTNPIDEKRRQRLSRGLQNFGEFADQLIDDLSPNWKSAIHTRQWRTTLTVDAAPLRSLPLHQISTDDVLGVLKPIWHSKPETASRLRGRIERVLDAGKAKGLRDGENPARWKGHLSSLLSTRQKLTRGHHAALGYAVLPVFMELLRDVDGVSAEALELTILCALRSGEARPAHKGEFELGSSLWTVPAARMKRKIPLRVPLSTRAVEIVRVRIAEAGMDGFLFPGSGREGFISNMAMPNLLPHLGYPDITIHGFRSTFRDWVGDCTTFPRELAEAALHHVAGDAVEQAYRRSDAFHPRKPLMDAWAKYCAGGSASVVVSMPGVSQDSSEAKRAG